MSTAKVLPRNLAMPAPRPRPLPRAAINGSSVAPVCPISKDEAVPGAPPPLLALPPHAVDLPSAIRAINQLVGIINILINPSTVNNLNIGLQLPKPVWVETNRKMVKERVYNPLDRSMWVDVEHIAMLEMTDKRWGQAITLLYQAAKAGGIGTAPTTGGGTTPTGPGGAAQTPGQ